jgi:thiol:disulfide interchange protein
MNFMKKIFLIVILLPFFLVGQILTPVKWSFSQTKTSDNNYDLKFKATIDKTWHIYSQYIADNGPVPTKFTFLPNPDVTFEGKTFEPKGHEEHDPNFDMKLVYFENEVTFVQKVKVAKTTRVKGNVEYMVCAMQCLPPTKEQFEFALDGSEGTVVETQSLMIENSGKTNTATPTTTSASTPTLTLNLPGASTFNPLYFDQAKGISDPVTWEVTPGGKNGNKFVIRFKATLEKGFHIYGPEKLKNGPNPTYVTYDVLENAKPGELIAKTKTEEKMDPVYRMKVRSFENEVEFTQEIETSDSAFFIGKINYTACDAQKCLAPQSYTFGFAVNKGEIVIVGWPEMPETKTSSITASAFPYKHPTINAEQPLSTCTVTSDEIKGKGLWTIFILGFVGGLLALITPCVFPMIPLTVSFFTKSSEGKKGVFNATLYGFFILLVYVVLSLPFHLLDTIDPTILNTISTNAWLNVFFFLVFTVFAISFFGFFEITLPSSLANKVDSASNIGGMIGIFFMALTLALVSFSCTGPILGSLLAGSLTSDGGAWQLTAGMAGFGLALALPFSLFAMFPSWLSKLPKSGGWLSKVKVILGFIEVGLAVKFLSNADLVEHWGLVKYEIFLGSWVLISLVMFLYLLGKIRFPHDDPFKKWTIARFAFTSLSLILAIYFSFGFRFNKQTQTYDSLSWLSGLPPPPGYSILHPNHCPQNLNCFHDYEEGLAYARQTGKPIMLDFTGWACVSCRKMEENVWSQPEVFKLINEKYVLISLYVDDREVLAADKQHNFMTAQGKLKRIETVGDKWATFQTETFVNNSQPYYALLSTDEKLLVKPVGYTPNVSEFASYLTCGLEANNAAKK